MSDTRPIEITIRITAKEQSSWAQNEYGEAELTLTVDGDVLEANGTPQVAATVQDMVDMAVDNYFTKKYEREAAEEIAKQEAEEAVKKEAENG